MDQNELVESNIYLFHFFAQGGQLLPTGHESSQSASLHLSAIDRKATGLYECHADNGIGQPSSAFVKLQVLCELVTSFSSETHYH